MTHRMKTEQEIFSNLQQKLYLEKQGLEQQVSLMEHEVESVRIEFEKHQSEEVEEMTKYSWAYIASILKGHQYYEPISSVAILLI